jgi:hypothetical protein
MTGCSPFEPAQEVALADLRVVAVEQDLDVAPTEFRDDASGLLAVRQEVALARHGR